MENTKLGRQTFQPGQPPVIIGFGSAAGNKESSGPLGRHFDHTCKDDKFGAKTWEQAESAMQGLALDAALKRAGLHTPDLDLMLAGDLLNQCIGSGYAARAADVPFLGLYGACSTMGESLALASLLLSGGYGTYAAAVTSSHFCSAERQYRTPLEYGSQRTPTAQWTATAAGAVIVTNEIRPGPRVARVTVGKVVDKGIKDANNMGAAMAPAAYAARWVAKNIVAAGLAGKCQVQLAYAIGVAKPVSVRVDTFGTGSVSDEALEAAVDKVFDLRPTAIINRLDLRKPLYRQTAAYGHFGRPELDLPWEKTDMVEAVKAAL